MNIRFSADIIEDSGLHNIISSLLISRYFNEKDYGNNEVKIFFVINCIGENTKLRKRYDSKNKTLYWDVILSYETVMKAKLDKKKAMLAMAIINSFDILDSYKKLNIDKAKIKEDTELYFKSIGWLNSVTD